MSQERKALSAQVDPDSDLAQDFDEYREKSSTNSNAEAIRDLLQTGIDYKFDRVDDRSSKFTITMLLTEIITHTASFAIASAIAAAVGLFDYELGLLFSGGMLAIAAVSLLILKARQHGVPGR